IEDSRTLYYAVEVLAPHFTPTFRERLWKIAREKKAQPKQRLHALLMLAASDADNAAWKELAPEAVAFTLEENALFLGLYRVMFEPVKRHLQAALLERYRNPRQPNDRLQTATLLVSYASGDAATLLELLAWADARAFEVLLP